MVAMGRGWRWLGVFGAAASTLDCGGTLTPVHERSPNDGGTQLPVVVVDAQGATEAAASPADAGCQNGSTQCTGQSVQICQSDGTWDPPWPCATGSCVEGACAGFTTDAASCQVPADGVSNCGADDAGMQGESCCTSIEVPGGTYYRVYDDLLDGGVTDLGDPATVSGFRLDKYLVTVGRFRQYVNYLADGGAAPVPGSGIHSHLNGGLGVLDNSQMASDGGAVYETGYQPSPDGGMVSASEVTSRCLPGSTWTAAPGVMETDPIGCLDWYDAYAFCIWDGGFLPSAAEWEYVAAGGNDERAYPWGLTNPGASNDYAVYDFACFYPSSLPCGLQSIDPVGSATLGASRWGQLDMAGEYFEWNLDFFGLSPYNPPLCVNCATLSPDTSRVMHGGSTTGSNMYLLSWVSSAQSPLAGAGVRCARTP